MSWWVLLEWNHFDYMSIDLFLLTIQLENFLFKIYSSVYLGDNCIQNFHLGRYIVGYTVGNFVLRRRVSGAVKHNFRTYIRWYTAPNENFEYGYPHSNVLFYFYASKQGIYCKTLAAWATWTRYVDQSQMTFLMTSGFLRYIAEYTVAICKRCPIRRRVIFASALEFWLKVL